MILRPEFFRELAFIWEFFDMERKLAEIKTRGSTKYWTKEGEPITIRDAEKLRPNLLRLSQQIDSSTKEFRESGVFFLLPPKVRHEYDETLRVLYSFADQLDDKNLELFRKRTERLSKSLAKSLGIAGLG